MSQNDVFMKLAQCLSTTEANDKNFVFSPLSLHVVLSLIATGSSDSTRDELLGFLKSESVDELNKLCSDIASYILADGTPSGGPELRFANGVWVHDKVPLKLSFVDTVCGVYKASIANLDFSKAKKVVSQVNKWVEDQTKGLIKEVLPSKAITPKTRLIISNALYFKGDWNVKFDKYNTRPYDFYFLNNGSIKVPFMTSYKKQYLKTTQHCKVLRLPYERGVDFDRQFSMYVFLPHERDGLWNLMEKLSSQPGFLEEHIPLRKVEVGQFRLPKFKILFDFEATKVLKSLGVEKPFVPGSLTNMVESEEDFYVSNIFQKSFIEVDEEGTEAAAVTTAPVYGTLCASFYIPENFVADHPFMFMIREDISGVVLFIGHVMDPSLS
ncbi:serpin-ZXA-like [Silene latifolia]|uniref:serpin-ZXA-like n=1 Tax=Silene latifolia TaxID=37657 RepID=UPI003D76FC3E